MENVLALYHGEGISEKHSVELRKKSKKNVFPAQFNLRNRSLRDSSWEIQAAPDSGSEGGKGTCSTSKVMGGGGVQTGTGLLHWVLTASGVAKGRFPTKGDMGYPTSINNPSRKEVKRLRWPLQARSRTYASAKDMCFINDDG